MSNLQVANVLSGLAVSDLEAASEWMARLLGRPADARPMEGLADWHFPPHGTIQLVLDADGNSITLIEALPSFDPAASE